MRTLILPTAALGMLMLAGCGDSGGDSGGGSSLREPSFNGGGGELNGYFVYRVTSASGFYKTDYYAPVGLTGNLALTNDSPGVFELAFTSAVTGAHSILLDADLDTRTYTTTTTYLDASGGAHDGKWIDETWSLSFAGAIATLTVDARIDEDNTNNYTSGVTGRAVLALSNPTPWTNADANHYGVQTVFTSDNRYVGQTGLIQGSSVLPGSARAFVVIDGAYGLNWNDRVYIDAFERQGNTLVGGGFYAGEYFTDDWLTLFATVTINLDAAGNPTWLGMRTVDPADGSVSDIVQDGFRAQSWLNTSTSNTAGVYEYTINVTSVTGGGLLAFENLTGDIVETHGSWFDMSTFGALCGGKVSANKRTFVLWDGRQYLDGAMPGYDLDGDGGSMERYTIAFDLDEDGEPTGGLIYLEAWDLVTDELIGLEDLTFTLTQVVVPPAPPAP